MEFTFLDFLMIIGALGFFIYGMKMMSDGIQKVAGNRMRQILGGMTKNRYLGVISGFLITALVQSSSATTVMTVSFVNAGLLSLVESAGIMMGANIGTTITAWLVSIFGFKVKIAAFSLPIIAVATPMLFANKSNLKSWGETLIGFALLFMGLSELKHAVPDLRDNPEVLAFLSSYTDMGILSSLLFVGVGTLITIILQSSSAAMTLTLVMCHQGWIPYETAAAMVLGENIGTTITAELASLIGNVHAKRSARIHSMFNIVGVTWMILAMPIFLKGIDYILTDKIGMASPFTSSESVPIALSYFHTTFNLTNVLILIWFVPFLVKIAIKSVPSKGDDDEVYSLEHIGKGLLSTPELSILEAKKEVNKFSELTQRMTSFVPPLLTEKDKKVFSKTLKRVKKYEDITDRIEVEVVSFLTKTSQNEISEDTANEIRGLLRIVSNLEKIGDLNYHMSLSIEKKTEENAWFTQQQRDYLMEMFDLIDKAFIVMGENINKSKADINLQVAIELENQINELRQKMSEEHFKSIEKGDYNIKSGLCYNKLYNSLEKIGDHILNVNEAASGLNIE